MSECPPSTIAWPAINQDSAQTIRSGALNIQRYFTTPRTAKTTLTAVVPAVEDMAMKKEAIKEERIQEEITKDKTSEAATDESPQATDHQPEFTPSECFSEDDYEEEEELIKRLQDGAMDLAKKVVAEMDEAYQLSNLEFLALGGYHHVWVVTYYKKSSKEVIQTSEDKKLVLRISRDTPSLQPYQVQHEVACLTFLANNLPNIPAPKVYAWNDGSNSGQPFIAEEFIDGQRLCAIWPQLTEEQKSRICREIANVIADLGETRFQIIGGLTLESFAGPTIEAGKLFNGRSKFHSPECYNIGPYTDSKDYILSCYDREIFYYTHATDSDIIADAFENISVTDFVTSLRHEQQSLLNDESIFQSIDLEPLVLVHEDFHAGNILIRDGHVVGILDWEFSGTYPLSELLGKINILQISLPNRDDFSEEEETKWHERYRKDVEDVVRQRGWRDQEVSTMMSDGHRILRTARSIRFPETSGAESTDDD